MAIQAENRLIQVTGQLIGASLVLIPLSFNSAFVIFQAVVGVTQFGGVLLLNTQHYIGLGDNFESVF